MVAFSNFMNVDKFNENKTSMYGKHRENIIDLVIDKDMIFQKQNFVV